jgi:hypothetical protein
MSSKDGERVLYPAHAMAGRKRVRKAFISTAVIKVAQTFDKVSDWMLSSESFGCN